MSVPLSKELDLRAELGDVLGECCDGGHFEDVLRGGGERNEQEVEGGVSRHVCGNRIHLRCTRLPTVNPISKVHDSFVYLSFGDVV